MEKDAWIQEKIKKLIDEGKTSEEATAIAHSMWDKEHMPMAKPIKMPILSFTDSKTVDGRKIPDKVKEAVLAYDASIRPAHIKLDTNDAHGDANTPALGRVERTYLEDGMIYAEVMPQTGYEQLLPALCAKDGQYPGRSIEVDSLNFGDSKKLWLEAVALVGAGQRPAVNLPPVQFKSNQTQFHFTVNLTGGESMEDNKVEEQLDEKITLAVSKAIEADRIEFAKKEASLREEIASTNAKLVRTELINSERFAKLTPAQKTQAIDHAMSLEAESRENFLKFLDTITEQVDTTEVAGHVGNQFAKEEEKGTESYKVELIKTVGKEKGYDLSKPEGYEKAMIEAERREPEAFMKGRV